MPQSAAIPRQQNKKRRRTNSDWTDATHEDTDEQRRTATDELCETSPLILINLQNITKTRLFKYTENFTTKKWKFLDKNSVIFHISAQNIDCGYS